MFLVLSIVPRAHLWKDIRIDSTHTEEWFFTFFQVKCISFSENVESLEPFILKKEGYVGTQKNLYTSLRRSQMS